MLHVRFNLFFFFFFFLHTFLVSVIYISFRDESSLSSVQLHCVLLLSLQAYSLAHVLGRSPAFVNYEHVLTENPLIIQMEYNYLFFIV